MQLVHANIQPRAVFFTHLHPDHTAGVSALGPQMLFVFGKVEASFWALAAVANHFSGKAHFSSIDFSVAPAIAPLGPSVDVFGDGSFWAISAPGHTDGDIAYQINGRTPVLLTGDASHFAWGFNSGIAPHRWNKGNCSCVCSLKTNTRLRSAYPNVKLIYGHEATGS